MRILSLDISTHTGWSYLENGKLARYGIIEVPVPGFKAEIKSFRDYPPEYPGNFLGAARALALALDQLITELQPDCIVSEETNKAKARFSQKILEFLHYGFLTMLEEHHPTVKFRYLTTKCWRDVTQCYIKDWPEYAKWNSKIGRLKAKAKPTKSGAKVAKLDGKIVTKVDQKKLSVILANQHFGLDIDNDNIADSLNMLRAAVELKLFS
jgi:hypothetical protein